MGRGHQEESKKKSCCLFEQQKKKKKKFFLHLFKLKYNKKNNANRRKMREKNDFKNFFFATFNENVEMGTVSDP